MLWVAVASPRPGAACASQGDIASPQGLFTLQVLVPLHRGFDRLRF